VNIFQRSNLEKEKRTVHRKAINEVMKMMERESL
jgi:hypothetical protein